MATDKSRTPDSANDPQPPEVATDAAPAINPPSKAVEAAASPSAATSNVVSLPEAPINFSVYCRIKGIPPRHMPGMAAFTKLERGTVAEWDEVFKSY